MVDYNFSLPQQQYYQAPDFAQNAMRLQQMRMQFAQADATNRLRAQQAQSLAQEQQFNELKMQEYKRVAAEAAAARAQSVAERNALAAAIKGSAVGSMGPQMPDLGAAANTLAAKGLLGPATTALAAANAFTASDKAKADLSKVDIENTDKDLATFRTFAASVRSPEDAGIFAAAMYDDPRIGKLMSRLGLTRDQAIAKAQNDYAADPNQWKAAQVGLSAQQVVDTLKQKQEKTDLGGSISTQTLDAFGRPIGEPVVQAKTLTPKEAQEKETPEQKLEYQANLQKQKAQIETDIENAKTAKQLDTAINELEKASARGGLIEKATGSRIGYAADEAARVVGYGTPGANANAELAPIADLVLKMVPRFEGPQSNADVDSYNKAAGQLANPTLPSSTRVAAAKTIIRLMKDRKDQFGMKNAGENAGAGASKIVNFGDLK